MSKLKIQEHVLKDLMDSMENSANNDVAIDSYLHIFRNENNRKHIIMAKYFYELYSVIMEKSFQYKLHRKIIHLMPRSVITQQPHTTFAKLI